MVGLGSFSWFLRSFLGPFDGIRKYLLLGLLNPIQKKYQVLPFP